MAAVQLLAPATTVRTSYCPGTTLSYALTSGKLRRLSVPPSLVVNVVPASVAAANSATSGPTNAPDPWGAIQKSTPGASGDQLAKRTQDKGAGAELPESSKTPRSASSPPSAAG